MLMSHRAMRFGRPVIGATEATGWRYAYSSRSDALPHRVLVDPKPHLVMKIGDQLFGSSTTFLASAVVELVIIAHHGAHPRARFFHTTHSSMIQGKDVRKAEFLGSDRCTQLPIEIQFHFGKFRAPP